jgi:hypothetical protein
MVRSGGTARQALDALISLHLLAEAARRQQGFSPAWRSDPELKSALAERLMEREIEPKLVRESVPEAELNALYQKAIKAFVHPRLVDIAVLAVYTGALMKKEPRLKRAETARALADYLATRSISGPEDFEAIARDPVWQERKVTFRRTLQGPDEPFSEKVGSAVAKLKAPGDTTSLIEDESGFFFATYAGERPPENITFAEARPSLLQRYYERWRKTQLEHLIQKLGEGHRIEAHPQLLQ